MEVHYWSDEEKAYLEEIVFGRSHKEILKLMNSKFEYQFTAKQIKNAIKRYKLNTGRTGRFEKGHVPANKGTKGMMKPNKTSFKKGNVPMNKRPVGSERVNIDGYVEVKVSENKWQHKHRVLYEQHHNIKLKSTDAVIFLDQDKSNLDINNLYKVTRKQLLELNQNGLIHKNGELTRAGINVADILLKLKELNK